MGSGSEAVTRTDENNLNEPNPKNVQKQNKPSEQKNTQE